MPWEKIVKWFGYKLHLIVDAVYELPVAFEMTRASASEMPQGRSLVKKLKAGHKKLVDDCEALRRAKEKRLDRLRSLTRVA